MKSLLKKTAQRFGIHITRLPPVDPVLERARELGHLLTTHKIDLILDIGANIGQYAQFARLANYAGPIVSFEPLTNAHQQLANIARNDPRWIVAPRMAIGNREGEAELHISGNSVSSSTREIMGTHLDAAPESAYVGSEKVKVTCLDTVAGEYLKGASAAYLKVDTQGTEAEVLEGATRTLPRIRGLQLELSTVRLYEGERLFTEMIDNVEKLGFEIHFISPGLIDTKTGRLMQADVIFFRPS